MKKILLIVMLTACFACDDARFEELNRPKKNAALVPGETLFANGVRNLFDLMSSADVNSNVFRLYGQYWAQTTYPDESQYNMVTREIPDNFWTYAYRDVLKDLDESILVTMETAEALGLSESQKNNRVAIAQVCKVYMFSVLVDIFGAIPYTEALDENILIPSYDPGATVYDGIIADLDNALALMNENEDGYSNNQDPVYLGDVAGWKKFANSLKLRLAMNLADVDAGKSSTMIAQALASGIMESNEDNASITYLPSPPNTNPVWTDLVQSGRSDYVIANTVVDKLMGLNDPRLPVFATTTSAGTFNGGIYGSDNTYSARSHIGDVFHQADLEGIIMDYAEVQFLLAEAAARGVTVPMTAAGHYHEGITASMDYWGISQTDIDAYIAQPEVAYATAAGDWKQKIGTQEWIALFNRGYAGWTAWRRLDFTGFNPPPGLAVSDIPTRMIFPIQEATLNPSNLQEAITLIGTDNATTKVFWDVN